MWRVKEYRWAGAQWAWPSKIAIAVLWLLALSSLGPSGEPRAAAAAKVDRFDVVVIDAGHGGEDEGAQGARGLIEKRLVLDVAKRLAGRLRARGLKVVLTRGDDTFVPLERRTAIANDARADLFVSIHANSARESGPHGFETYFVSLDSSDESAKRVAARENGAFGADAELPGARDPLVALLGDMLATEYVMESSEFAKLVQDGLAQLDGSPSRGVKQAPFVVLMGVQMPAALIEIGFLSNREEERALLDSPHRDAIAAAVGRAVVAFGKRYDARRGFAAPSPGEASGARAAR